MLASNSGPDNAQPQLSKVMSTPAGTEVNSVADILANVSGPIVSLSAIPSQSKYDTVTFVRLLLSTMYSLAISLQSFAGCTSINATVGVSPGASA